MNSRWASDFSYSYFKQILQTILSKFKLHLLSQAPYILEEHDTRRRHLVLRHDVDVSLKRAFTMAEIERKFKINATYMVMTESSLYRIDNDYSCEILCKMTKMGHEIGLHIDPHLYGNKFSEKEINSACEELEAITGSPVLSVSFHRPPQRFMGGALKVANRVNAYAVKLLQGYRSDSRGYWKDGAPLLWLREFNEFLCQLLIHPIWWGDEHMSREERVQAFVFEESRGKPPNHAETLRKKIIETINVEFNL